MIRKKKEAMIRKILEVTRENSYIQGNLIRL